MARHENSDVGTYLINFLELLLEALPFPDLFPGERLLLPLLRKKNTFFSCLRIDCKMISNHSLSYLYVTIISMDISTARYWICISEWPSKKM